MKSNNKRLKTGIITISALMVAALNIGCNRSVGFASGVSDQSLSSINLQDNSRNSKDDDGSSKEDDRNSKENVAAKTILSCHLKASDNGFLAIVGFPINQGGIYTEDVTIQSSEVDGSWVYSAFVSISSYDLNGIELQKLSNSFPVVLGAHDLNGVQTRMNQQSLSLENAVIWGNATVTQVPAIGALSSFTLYTAPVGGVLKAQMAFGVTYLPTMPTLGPDPGLIQNSGMFSDSSYTMDCQ